MNGALPCEFDGLDQDGVLSRELRAFAVGLYRNTVSFDSKGQKISIGLQNKAVRIGGGEDLNVVVRKLKTESFELFGDGRGFKIGSFGQHTTSASYALSNYLLEMFFTTV